MPRTYLSQCFKIQISQSSDTPTASLTPGVAKAHPAEQYSHSLCIALPNRANFPFGRCTFIHRLIHLIELFFVGLLFHERHLVCDFS